MNIEVDDAQFDLWLTLLGKHIDNLGGYIDRLKSDQRREVKLHQLRELISLETTLCMAAGLSPRQDRTHR